VVHSNAPLENSKHLIYSRQVPVFFTKAQYSTMKDQALRGIFLLLLKAWTWTWRGAHTPSCLKLNILTGWKSLSIIIY